jgi:hypothetical protein
VGQLDFEGNEVHGSKLIIPGLGETDWVTEPGEEPPGPGDEVEIRYRGKVVVGFPQTFDKTGTATSQLVRAMTLKPSWEGFEIVGIRRKADIDAMWLEQHGAQA